MAMSKKDLDKNNKAKKADAEKKSASGDAGAKGKLEKVCKKK